VEPGDGVALLISKEIGDQHVLHKDGYYIPMRYTTAGEGFSIGMFNDTRPNLSAAALRYLEGLGYTPKEIAEGKGEAIWFHCLAIAHAPAYMAENADDLATRPPRFPLPASRNLLERSADLGRKLFELSDVDAPVNSVTAGVVPGPLGDVAKIVTADGKPLTEEDLEITTPWGRRGINGVSGGNGKIVVWRDGELLPEVADEELEHAGGDVTLDVYLNDRVYWKGIPRETWQYSVAGYQVLKKWLSYRALAVLDRPLDVDEARQFSETARRITTILAMVASLDGNYATANEKNAKF